MEWKGNPFVDAAAAAAKAVAEKYVLKEKKFREEALTPKLVDRLANRLIDVLTDDMIFATGPKNKKPFYSSVLQVLLPNSPLAQPAYGRDPQLRKQKFAERVQDIVQKVKMFLQAPGGRLSCPLCGKRMTDDLVIHLRRSHLPLLLGKVNFYPHAIDGERACPLCAFYLLFLPLAVFITAKSNVFMIAIDYSSPERTAEIIKRLSLKEVDEARVKNSPFKLHTIEDCGSRENAALALYCHFIERLEGKQIYQYLNEKDSNVIVYFFSNNQQNPFIYHIFIPNEILNFLFTLAASSKTEFNRFKNEVITQRWVTGQRILGKTHIISTCKSAEKGLAGGWYAHILYAQEVLKVNAEKLAAIEELAKEIAKTARDSKDLCDKILYIEKAANAHHFLSVLQKKFNLTHEVFALCDGDTLSFFDAKDYLLAALYELYKTGGKLESPVSHLTAAATPAKVPEMIRQIGDRILQAPINLKHWLEKISQTNNPWEIRRRYLKALSDGGLDFDSFVFLVPPDDPHRQLFWLRLDYLIAYLTCKLRNNIKATKGGM
jgi:CRISPR-associated protein Cas8b1/Cst1 subtype I-B